MERDLDFRGCSPHHHSLRSDGRGQNTGSICKTGCLGEASLVLLFVLFDMDVSIR